MKTSEEISNLIKSIPCKEDPTFNILKEKDLEPLFRYIIKSRMEHCLSELEKWKDNSNTYSHNQGQMVFFPNGKHFSFPVYRQLEEALKLDMCYWSRLIWQQIVRHMYLSEIKNIELFTYATDMLVILK